VNGKDSNHAICFLLTELTRNTNISLINLNSHNVVRVELTVILSRRMRYDTPMAHLVLSRQAPMQALRSAPCLHGGDEPRGNDIHSYVRCASHTSIVMPVETCVSHRETLSSPWRPQRGFPWGGPGCSMDMTRDGAEEDPPVRTLSVNERPVHTVRRLGDVFLCIVCVIVDRGFSSFCRLGTPHNVYQYIQKPSFFLSFA
jgi:hypothetical protein